MQCYCVAYGVGVYVVGGDVSSGSSAAISYSSDGVTWNDATISIANALVTAIAWSGSLFVAVCQTSSGATTSSYATSPDGVTWTVRTALPLDVWTGVAYGNGVFVAVSHSNRVYSSDGLSWSASAPSTSDLSSVIFANGKFMAVLTATMSPALVSSTDGHYWTDVYFGGGGFQQTAVTYGNGLWLAIGYPYTAGVGYQAFWRVSANGVHWAPRMPGSIGSDQARAVAYGNGKWVVLGNSSAYAPMLAI
jgi:hypothetical protein